jgi:dienelactone hydrolase
MPRHLLKLLAATVLAALAMLGNVAATEWLTDEQDELDRTWAGGYIFYPKANRFSWGHIGEVMGDANATLAGRRYPTIVYMHGCSGIDIASTQTARDFLLKGGFVVVMPDSFARRNKPVSCILKSHTSGLHRAVIFWRQAEARNAIREAKRLPFVDPNNVFLVGLSEGAITTATTSGNEHVNARIVEGWTCHAGWPEYWGLAAPKSEPVLTLSSDDDPWFQIAVLKGDCGVFMNKRNGSKAVIWHQPHPLATEHFQLWHPDAMAVALQFLRAHMK